MHMQEIDDVTALLEEMNQYLSYDPETGQFTWIKTTLRSNAKVGDIAGKVNNEGYISIQFKCKSYASHRLAWLFTYGKWPINQIDHIDVNPTNNKINNLRDVTDQENKFNRKKVNSFSGYMGVYKTRNKNIWRAAIKLNYKFINLGTYATPELASEAYQAAKLKYHVIGNANES